MIGTPACMHWRGMHPHGRHVQNLPGPTPIGLQIPSESGLTQNPLNPFRSELSSWYLTWQQLGKLSSSEISSDSSPYVQYNQLARNGLIQWPSKVRQYELAVHAKSASLLTSVERGCHSQNRIHLCVGARAVLGRSGDLGLGGTAPLRRDEGPNWPQTFTPLPVQHLRSRPPQKGVRRARANADFS